MKADLAVVVLAGGKGSRLGGDKPLRMLRGERLINRALREARRWSDCVAVSVANANQAREFDAPHIVDEAGVQGPLSGLVAAFRFAEKRAREFLLVIPTDSPFLPVDLFSRLAEAIGERLCAVPGSGGHLHPDCTLWRTTATQSVPAYLITERRSLVGFAEFVGFATVEWSTEPFDPFFNVNTPDDLARAERLL